MSKLQLSVENFRLFAKQKISFKQNNVINGSNGTGKTTLLEALRLLSVGKSFRTSRLDELIKFDEAYFRLSLTHEDQHWEFFYGKQFPTSTTVERSFKLNNQTLTLINYLGTLPSVVFVPEDINIITGSPAERRRWLDGVLWQTSLEFRSFSLELARILKERSALLFLLKINRADPAELTPWNELLEEKTNNIRQLRRLFVEYINSNYELIPHSITGRYTLQVTYEYDQRQISETQAEEIKTAQNVFGAHRDELVFNLNDRLARRYASRGQARTLLSCLKLIEAKYLQQETKKSPLLLFDDVFSELDKTNSEALIEGLGSDYNIFLTTAKPIETLTSWNQLQL